jgi:DNA-3-methyladenine glycosylase I
VASEPKEDDGIFRCFGGGDPLYARYHDEEWGARLTSERDVFERVSLEAFQSGLSWLTILRKRDGFRAAFENFEPERVATYAEPEILRLLGDAGIVRHRGKIEATIANAQATVALREAGTTLSELVWSYAPASPRPVATSLQQLEASTPESVALAKALRALGFRFVGPITMYSVMQAIGVVNDHVADCPVRARLLRSV